MQLFIIHFLILPIKKFKKQKLKIIFFNFLNKCNRYNIYCVSYYKGNLGKESCTYMKAYKKIISFILTLVMMLSLSVNVFAAEPLTDDPNMIEWKYTVLVSTYPDFNWSFLTWFLGSLFWKYTFPLLNHCYSIHWIYEVEACYLT